MIRTHERKIDDAIYTVTQFPARLGLSVKTELIKLIAPTFLSMSGNLDADLSSNDGLRIIESLCSKLDSDKLEALILKMFSMTKRNGKDINQHAFDDIYSGNFVEMYQALAFICEANFGNFFQALKGKMLEQNIGNPSSNSKEPVRRKKKKR